MRTLTGSVGLPQRPVGAPGLPADHPVILLLEGCGRHKSRRYVNAFRSHGLPRLLLNLPVTERSWLQAGLRVWAGGPTVPKYQFA